MVIGSKLGRHFNMANIITGIRILCSIALLFFSVFSPIIYILYIVAGLSDMIDGTVARKTGRVSEFGSRFDTVADLAFVVVCMIKMIPALDIPIWLMIWIAVIALIKVVNIILGYVWLRKLVAAHTVMNKITGFALFLLPLTVSIIDLRISGVIICVLATFAAISESDNIFSQCIQPTSEEIVI